MWPSQTQSLSARFQIVLQAVLLLLGSRRDSTLPLIVYELSLVVYPGYFQQQAWCHWAFGGSSLNLKLNLVTCAHIISKPCLTLSSKRKIMVKQLTFDSNLDQTVSNKVVTIGWRLQVSLGITVRWQLGLLHRKTHCVWHFFLDWDWKENPSQVDLSIPAFFVLKLLSSFHHVHYCGGFWGTSSAVSL